MKILIADDHWLMRKSLKEVIARMAEAITTYEASDFEECLGILRAERTMDLVLADLVMPGFNEFEGLERLRAAFPQVPVVVVSVHEDRQHVLRALDLGVIGYIPKSASGSEIEVAFSRVLAGEVYLPRRLIERTASDPFAPAPPVAAGVDDESLKSLTEREREVLSFLGRGFSVQRIAKELGLSDHTARVHLANLMRKLGLPDRSAAIHFAINFANARPQPGGA